MAEIESYWDDIRIIQEEELPWDLLKDSSILVVGATGLIGSCLIDVLMNTNVSCQVYAAGRNEERAKKRFAQYWDADNFHFLRQDVMQPIASDKFFDYIIDAASHASPNFFSMYPVEVIKSNIDGVSNLIDYGRRHQLRRFLYISTGEIYGTGAGTFREIDSGYVNSMLPRSCYPSSKRAAETLCASYTAEYGVDTVVARLSHTYGPHFTESDNRVYAQFIRNVLNDENILMKSDGSQLRSWCYVVDCVKALLYILLKGKKGEAYNVADPSSCFSIRQLAETIAKASGKKVIIQLPAQAEGSSNSQIPIATFDIGKLQSLGFQIRGRWEDKLMATIVEQQRVSRS